MVTFKPSPPKSGRRARQESPAKDDLHATAEDFLCHGRAAADRPVPEVALGAMEELRWKGKPKKSNTGPQAGDWKKWELKRLDTWNPSGPDPNKVKDPLGKGVFSAFDPKGGAARETGMALPGARDTWRPAHGRRADAKPQPAAEKPVWSPNRHYPEGLHQLKGANRAPHPFNMTTEYPDSNFIEPTQEERRKGEAQLNALRMLRSKIDKSFRMSGRTITDIAGLFEAMDADGSGGLSYDEFTEGLKAMGLVFGPKQLASVIEALDADGDGEITIKEFLMQCDDAYREDGALGELDAEMHERAGTVAPTATKKAKLLPNPSVFGETMNLTMAADLALRNRHTKDGGAARFRLAVKKEAQPVSPIAAAAVDRIFAFIKKEQLKVIDMFYRIDVDGSGEIEPAEIVHTLTKMGLRLSKEELDAVVYELDVDGDGTVELHEYM
jgi:Ca2+-binding EF-hand superfamily protein